MPQAQVLRATPNPNRISAISTSSRERLCAHALATTEFMTHVEHGCPYHAVHHFPDGQLSWASDCSLYFLSPAGVGHEDPGRYMRLFHAVPQLPQEPHQQQ